MRRQYKKLAIARKTHRSRISPGISPARLAGTCSTNTELLRSIHPGTLQESLAIVSDIVWNFGHAGSSSKWFQARSISRIFDRSHHCGERERKRERVALFPIIFYYIWKKIIFLNDKLLLSYKDILMYNSKYTAVPAYANERNMERKYTYITLFQVCLTSRLIDSTKFAIFSCTFHHFVNIFLFPFTKQELILRWLESSRQLNSTGSTFLFYHVYYFAIIAILIILISNKMFDIVEVLCVLINLQVILLIWFLPRGWRMTDCLALHFHEIWNK